MANSSAEKMANDIVELTASNRTKAAARDLADTIDEIVDSTAKQAANAARLALEFEVELTPKPGLVDTHDLGSHPDMAIEMFYSSAKALEPFFAAYWLIGATHRREDIFPALRTLGLKAEAAMLQATGGKNTHKGAHFCFALVLAAASFDKHNSRMSSPKTELERLNRASCILSSVPAISGDLVAHDLKDMRGVANALELTAGERAYKDYSLGGIREEVDSGFPAITRYGMNLLESFAYTRRESLCTPVGGILAEDRKLALDYLMTLLTRIEDTTLIKRGGPDGLKYAKGSAIAYLRRKSRSPEWEEALRRVNHEFVGRNLSPGGAADLLAVTHLAFSLAML